MESDLVSPKSNYSELKTFIDYSKPDRFGYRSIPSTLTHTPKPHTLALPPSHAELGQKRAPCIANIWRKNMCPCVLIYFVLSSGNLSYEKHRFADVCESYTEFARSINQISTYDRGLDVTSYCIFFQLSHAISQNPFFGLFRINFGFNRMFYRTSSEKAR